jgi:hypothetical protein
VREKFLFQCCHQNLSQALQGRHPGVVADRRPAVGTAGASDLDHSWTVVAEHGTLAFGDVA